MESTSQRLERLIPEIMNVWMERALNEIKAANLQETLALRDSLPIYLTQLVDALSKTIDRTHARKKADKIDSTRIGKKHGRERAVSLEYTMDQMILEYHILRQVICDLLEKEVVLTPVEREVIVCSVEQAVNDAATQFSDTLREYQDHLSHTLAHDIRNPLMTIRSTAQLMEKQKNQSLEESEKNTTRIIRSSDRIDKMIRELLDSSRIKASHKHPIDFKEFDLDYLVKDIAHELNISNEDRFVVQSSGECLGDWNENFVRRLIENLATNAIKYGDLSKPVTLTITQTDLKAILRIHNFGAPIPEKDQGTLFVKFKRASGAEKQIGWGIGLTVVREMVEVHNGTIEVESSESEGTTFTMMLPKQHREYSHTPQE